MSRLIDADKLEPHEIYEDNGFTRVAYMDDIDEMPTVDAEPIRHGHWRKVDYKEPLAWDCSVCGAMCHYNTPYCPICGAKMDEVEE